MSTQLKDTTATQTTTTLTPYLCCRNAAEAIEFYRKAFGAEPMMTLRLPDGRIMHAALELNGAHFMLAEEFPEYGGSSPQALGGTPVALHLNVPDCDAVFQRAVDAGCQVRMPLQDMFWGDRYGLVVDPYGHQWSIATHQRQVSVEEMQQAVNEMGMCEGQATPE